MKRARIFFILLAMCSMVETFAQVSPYQIPPKWMFGLRAGFDFGTSPYTISPPNVLTGNPSNLPGMEASTAACDPASNLVFYTDCFRYYDYPANTTLTFPGTAPGSGSATDGAVAVPDPANPSTQYYLFTANDRTGGPPYQGINYYKVAKSGSTVTLTGPTNLIGGSSVDESICAGSDGNGGYWIVSHNYNNADYMIWHVTSGGVTASSQTPPTVAGNSPVNGIGTNAASFKINRCQDKIAYATASHVQVYAWDKVSGTVGTLLYHKSGIGNTIYGLEFSPNGNFVYYTELFAGGLYQIDLSNPTGSPALITTGSSNSSCSEMGTMQLGPDGKIYVTTCANAITTGAVYLGVINNPDALACNYSGTGFTLKPANAATTPSISRGIANMAWMTPQNPTITLSAGATCSEITHTINFNTYFNTPISLPSSPLSAIEWSFNNGTTWVSGNGTNTITHDYGGSVSTTARVRFYDQVCNNYQWTASIPVTTSCPVPVELIDFTAKRSGDNVLVSWSTIREMNNSHFVVQHSSDGINFTSIGTVQGHGNSNAILNYSLLDFHPSAGINYYRLIQYDFDGTAQYTHVVAVDMGGEVVSVYVFPNPSTDDFHIQISGKENLNLSVMDVLGREVFQTEVDDDHREFVFGKDFSQGTYIVQVVGEDFMKTVKVNKE